MDKRKIYICSTYGALQRRLYICGASSSWGQSKSPSFIVQLRTIGKGGMFCCVVSEQAPSILTNDICMIGLSLCTFCAFVKERWCRKQIRPFCNLVVIVIIITHNNPIWEVLLITSQVFKSPKTKKDLGPRWPGPSSSLSPSPFLMLRYVLMLLKPKWQSSSRIWSQSRSLFCHQSASCDHSQPTNAVQIQIQILKVQVQIHLYKHKLLLQLSANQCNAHCKMY